MTAPMDARSQPDKTAWGRWRTVVNGRAVEKGRLCRREGWRKFGYWTEHPNCDLYDQHGTAQAIRTLYAYQNPTRTSSGNRVFAATTTDIWSSRNDGGWTNVGSGLLPGEEWAFCTQHDVVVAVNGNSVLWQRVDFGSFAEILSLATIGLTGAAVCWTYEGCVFLADVVMDGEAVGHRVVWGDIDSIDFEPKINSVAGFQDFTPGERILCAVQTGMTITIFTTHGAWRLGVVNGEFTFQNLYFSKSRDACAVGRRAVLTNREVAYILASDGVYALTPYSPSPEWVEWINQGLPVSMTEVDACTITASGYDPVRNEAYFSAESLGITFTFNLRQTSSHIIDHAFRAMATAAIDRGHNVATWWVASGICSAAELDAAHPVGPRDDARVHPAVTGTASECTPFDPPCENCTVANDMIFVSADDNAIKIASDDIFAREMRAASGWELEGYGLRFVTGCLNWGSDKNKRVSRVFLTFTAPATDIPGEIGLTIRTCGSSFDPVDPGSVPRPLALSRKKLLLAAPKAPGDSPAAQPVQWTFVADGRFVAFDFSIPDVTGAAVCFSSFTAHVGESPMSAI